MVLSWRSASWRGARDIDLGLSGDDRSCECWSGRRSRRCRNRWGSGSSYGSVFVLMGAFIILFSVVGGALASEGVYQPSADLSMASEGSPDPVVAGEALTFIVTIRNRGPDDATGVLAAGKLTLPEGVTLISAIPSRGSYDAETGVWTVERLSVGGVETLTFRLEVGSSVQSGAVISCSAKVAGDGIDQNPDDNEAASKVLVTTDAQVAVVVKPQEESEGSDGRYSYVVEITNNGPSDAREVWFRDLLPPVELLSSARYSDDGGAAEEAWNGFMSLGDLTPGETERILIEVDLVPGYRPSVLVPTATVCWMDTTDPICNSDSFSLSREIGSSPDPTHF